MNRFIQKWKQPQPQPPSSIDSAPVQKIVKKNGIPSSSSSMIPKTGSIQTNATSSSLRVNTENAVSPEYGETVRQHSYIGKKGYTISKKALTEADLEFLKKDLFVKPVIMAAKFAPNADIAAAFPVYRENDNKIYLPRFYGIHRYGLPDRSDIHSGKNIDVDFVKPLRDYQDKIVDVYMKYVDTPICKIPSGDTVSYAAFGSGGILEVPCGRGKCLGKNTEILMYDGTIKLVQDVVVGDQIIGDDSRPRGVLSLARGRETMYKVKSTIDTHTQYTVNKSHILSLKNVVTGEIVDLSIEDYMSYPKKEDLRGYRVPIVFTETPVVDPYEYGYKLLSLYMTAINLSYLCNSRKNQLSLLAGIIDSEGDVGNTYFIHLPVDMRDKAGGSILYLIRSLGFRVLLYTHVSTSGFYIIEINSTIYADLSEIPTRIRKYKQQLTEPLDLTYQITLEELPEDEYYGFEIDGNHRFLLGDFTVTHNTVMGLKIISLLKKKTLIIVHKEFLMNQWIERIAEFLPTARVGKIQGNVVDIYNKDIVIGMVQTLYDKEYAPTVFEEFGLTIIDEVHRICSEQFSRTLFKTIMPYMLGISATVERKDKLTKVLHMFIGDKIYSEKRENDDMVCVRAIEYKSPDADFNEVEVDFRGSPKYSTMISKLCEFGPRSDFIVRIIRDLLEENPENQMMILCHNRSLLAYLYESIKHKELATVGYYVGGMKQTNLQETESKQIVLATYAMAAEALDIKTLSTLVMVTPKTDITQSVGRILRMKHESPIIVDIVDTHDLFQNQWVQRRRFYKKCNYRIRSIDSNRYVGMNFDWEEDKTWTRVFEPKVAACSNTKDTGDDEDEDLQPETRPKSVFGKLMINIEDL